MSKNKSEKKAVYSNLPGLLGTFEKALLHWTDFTYWEEGLGSCRSHGLSVWSSSGLRTASADSLWKIID